MTILLSLAVLFVFGAACFASATLAVCWYLSITNRIELSKPQSAIVKKYLGFWLILVALSSITLALLNG